MTDPFKKGAAKGAEGAVRGLLDQPSAFLLQSTEGTVGIDGLFMSIEICRADGFCKGTVDESHQGDVFPGSKFFSQGRYEEYSKVLITAEIQ